MQGGHTFRLFGALIVGNSLGLLKIAYVDYWLLSTFLVAFVRKRGSGFPDSRNPRKTLGGKERDLPFRRPETCFLLIYLELFRSKKIPATIIGVPGDRALF